MTTPTKAEVQKARDAWTKLIGATAKKAPALAQPALDTLPVLEAYGKSKLAVQPPPVENDSPDGTTIVLGGATITLRGKRFRIGTDGKIYINDAVEPSSAGVMSMKLVNGVLEQTNDKGDVWTQPWGGGPGVLVRGPSAPPPPVVVDPGTLPPVTGGIILPAGFRNFDGFSLTQAEADDYSGDGITSHWNPGDFAYDYRGDGPFVKSGVLGLRVFGLDDPIAPGGSEIQFNERFRYDNGEFWTLGKIPFEDGLNSALCWVYGFFRQSRDPNATGRNSEGDHEIYPGVGDALGMHHFNQSGTDGYAWVQRGFYGIDFTQPLIAGIKWRQNDSMAFFLSNYGSEPKQVGIVTKAMRPNDFIDEGMKGCISLRPTSYYEGDDAAKDAARKARKPMLAGWTGYWSGKANLMQVFGFKSNPI